MYYIYVQGTMSYDTDSFLDAVRQYWIFRLMNGNTDATVRMRDENDNDISDILWIKTGRALASLDYVPAWWR